MELFEKEEEGSEELEEGDTPVSVLELNGLLEILLEKRTCWNTFKQRDVEKKKVARGLGYYTFSLLWRRIDRGDIFGSWFDSSSDGY